MEKHFEFMTWAKRQGVTLYGIAPHDFDRRGIGIVAEKKHEAGELLLSVPASALRTVRTVPKEISKRTEKITVHGLLALELSLDSSLARAPWRAVLPTQAQIQESLPFTWQPELQDLLPPAAKALLENQQRKFEKDWVSASRAFPNITRELYVYNWLVVNTRTFYWIEPGMGKTPPRDDCMALNPFADYFNHAEDGCMVSYGPNGFKIVSNRVYEKDEEIYISYGNHHNDFLLVEYGFFLAENKWDEVKLDHIILPTLAMKQKDHLKDAGFLGNYILDRSGVCYRTQVVMRLCCVPLRTWHRFVNGEVGGERDQGQVDLSILKVVEDYQFYTKGQLERVASLESRYAPQQKTLSGRWEQVTKLLQLVIQTMIAYKNRISEME